MSHDEILPPPEEDDHDVLTFALAGNRLENEMRNLRSQIETLKASSSVDGEIERLSNRLVMLEAGAKRNAAPPITDSTFEQFFGYTGTPRGGITR
ncbi:acyl-CoA synthetase [Rhodococcus wratislaviensis]|uniref:acyl-CoA synthetase n=1 Tax=Rhodococcus wratislaviensis TaxID=44752 RepID=UPI0036585A73